MIKLFRVGVAMFMVQLCGCSYTSVPNRDLTVINVGNERIGEPDLSIDGRPYNYAVGLAPGIQSTFVHANYPIGIAILKWNYPDNETNKKQFKLSDYIDRKFDGQLIFKVSGHEVTIDAAKRPVP